MKMFWEIFRQVSIPVAGPIKIDAAWRVGIYIGLILQQPSKIKLRKK